MRDESKLGQSLWPQRERLGGEMRRQRWQWKHRMSCLQAAKAASETGERKAAPSVEPNEQQGRL